MKKFYTLFVACLLISVQALAADDKAVCNDAAAAKIDSLELRIAKMEKRSKNWAKVKQYLNFSGFIQAAYDWTDADNSSTFHVRRARLNLTGDLYRGKKGATIDYRLYFDLARIPKKAPILDMWVRYRPCKEFGIQMGQFKNKFSFEASIGPNKYDFIDFSYAVTRLAKMGSKDVLGLDMTARDLGVEFMGGFIHKEGYSVLNYNIAVLNGSGINVKDNNKSKDVMARLTVKPMKELAIAGYYQWGENVLSTEQAAAYGWTGNCDYVTSHRWGAGLDYNTKCCFVRGEYIGGITGKMRSESAYVSGGYKFYAPKMPGYGWVGAMVDYFTLDASKAKENSDLRYAICVGYQPVKYARIQLAYSLEQMLGDGRVFKNNRPFCNTLKVLVTASF